MEITIKLIRTDRKISTTKINAYSKRQKFFSSRIGSFHQTNVGFINTRLQYCAVFTNVIHCASIKDMDQGA